MAEGKVATICKVLRPGWHIKEEVPLMAIIFLVVFAVMWYFNPGTWTTEQIFGTAFLVSVVSVSLEVIYASIKCRM